MATNAFLLHRIYRHFLLACLDVMSQKYHYCVCLMVIEDSPLVGFINFEWSLFSLLLLYLTSFGFYTTLCQFYNLFLKLEICIQWVKIVNSETDVLVYRYFMRQIFSASNYLHTLVMASLRFGFFYLRK